MQNDRKHSYGESDSYTSPSSIHPNNYSELDNPFNDINLGQQFKWHKKIDKERKRGISPSTSRRLDGIRRKEAEEELAALNRRRTDREAERALRDEEELRMGNLADTAQMSEWLSKEGEFQLEQERSRAAIRIREKRAKAIDFLAQNLRYASSGEMGETGWGELEEDEVEIDLDEPYKIVEVRPFTQNHLLEVADPFRISPWSKHVSCAKISKDTWYLKRPE